MREVYLDNSATTRPLPEVVEAMVKTLQDNYGNPSSLHNKGLEAEKILKEARQKIARRLAASPEEIILLPAVRKATTWPSRESPTSIRTGAGI